MKTKLEISEIIAELTQQSKQALSFDEEAIAAEYASDARQLSIGIKILSIIGGLLACITFLGLLLLFGLYDSPSGMLILSLILIVGGLILNNTQDLIIFDSISVSAYISGYILSAFALSQLDFNESSIAFCFALLAMVSLFINQSYVLSFLSVLIVNGSLAGILIDNYALQLMPVLFAAITSLLFYMHKKEAVIIANARLLSKLFISLRLALVLSLFADLSLMIDVPGQYFSIYSLLIASAIFIAAILALLPTVFEQLNIVGKKSKVFMTTSILLCLLPSGLNPAVAASLFVMVLSFWKNYKPGLALGILGFLYFTSRFYYDLSFTLLIKSMLMLLSGALFFGVYFLIHKKLEAYEKV